ncbi:complex I NDUFA9 subunit family protein [Tropicimonas sp. IMCC6043]|uniref:complex I NDUFA9 subunit family protein n=1 Tax=Tropicimonas sp. IMCC6043 TaxID=2510645 RepID=UPI00101DDF7C|nr:complex I NDUFA9 subunit family protein [Tropicimonas sp. IMCC6043]RYH09960.1 complex I NDUFA9 subunit family protein [Tropicimonas sp. IMCC6043]
MSRLVTIYGGSGFVGRYIARRMAKEGWRVRVATRVPDESLFVRTYGEVGQVEPVPCNLRDEESVRAAMHSADAVVNCVGILAEFRKNTFDAIQAEGAERVARLAAEAGIETLVHISAIGADANSDSDYARTKAAGEAAVLRHMPNAVILRPSVIFGPEDEFFNRFASMSRFGPVLNIIGADTRFQPVYVDDVAKAAVAGVTGKAAPGIYELGGPDVASFRDLMKLMLKIVRRNRLINDVPTGIANLMAGTFGVIQKVTLGNVEAPLTRDQIRNLQRDNVVSEGAKTFADLGIEPQSLAAILPEYLWRYRPGGQFEALTESAANLKV